MFVRNWKYQAAFVGTMTAATALHWGAGLHFQAAALGVAGVWGLVGWLPFSGRSDLHGSARWATPREVKARGLHDVGGVTLGKLGGKWLRSDEAGHLITFAPTRRGKGVGQIIPTLLTYDGACFVTDIKGENHAVTARHRRDVLGQKVYKIDPNNPEQSAFFNPLDGVRRDPRHLYGDAGALAVMIVPHSGGNDSFWTESAQSLATALIMLACRQYGAQASMQHVRGWLMSGAAGLAEAFALMQADDALPALAQMGARLGSTQIKAAKQFEATLSTAETATAVWSYPDIEAVTSRPSSVNFADLKRERMTIYLCVRPDQLTQYKAFLRAVVGTACKAMTQDDQQPAKRVLFLLDEFPALGHMQSIQDAVGVAAGYGVRFWMFCQDMAQLRTHYRGAAATFVANCGVASFFGVSEPETGKMLSDALGRTTLQTVSESTTAQGAGVVATGASVNRSQTGRALMTPDEIRAMPWGNQVLMVQGLRPIYAAKTDYRKEPCFQGMWDRWGND